MRILITGGCGFVGTNLVSHLLTSGGFAIRVFDNLSVGTREQLASVTKGSSAEVVDSDGGAPMEGCVQLLVGDIRDRDGCMEATKDIDAVVHLAAHAGVVSSVQDPHHDFEMNAVGTLNLLDSSVKNKVGKFVFSSSNATVGDAEPPMRESLVPSPISPYGASKLSCEAYCSAFYGSYGLKTIVLRFSNAYGPNSMHKNSVVSRFIKDGLVKGEITIYGDGEQTRDFVHSTDICRTIATVVKSTDDTLPWGEPFNLGTGVETKIVDLAGTVKALFGTHVKVVHEPARAGEIARNYSDITKIKKAFGYEPTVKLSDGVKEVYEWFMARGAEECKNAVVLSGSD